MRPFRARSVYETYVEGALLAVSERMHDCGPPCGKREGGWGGPDFMRTLDKVERLGWHHAKTNRVVLSYDFNAEAIVVEADLHDRGVREVA